MEAKDIAKNNLTDELLFFSYNQRNFSYVYNLGAEIEDLSAFSIREIIIITCYSIIVIVSIFGNLLVCNIVARRASMRRTTYVFIANLALSDLLMTVLNIPFNVARVLLKDWPFGGFMCSFVPLVQVTSVYVSTFTMMCIALDRYRVICKPLKPRLSPLQASKSIVLMWCIAICLSLPHAVFNRIETVYSYRSMTRCRSAYPKGWSSWITLVTVLTQYLLPLSITGLAYFFIVAKVWSRDVLGVVTEAQLVTQARAKRKTIKMLLVVVILFALCWLPLNVYHLLLEFSSLEFTYNSTTIYFACHWLAMSSVCYNPFIYCCLNKNFRAGAVACIVCIRNVGRKLNSSFRSTRDVRLSEIHCEFPSQSFDSRMDGNSQLSSDIVCCCSQKQGLQKKSAKELVPMQSLCVKRCSDKRGFAYSEVSKEGSCCSEPNFEAPFPNGKPQHPLKMSLSWSK